MAHIFLPSIKSSARPQPQRPSRFGDLRFDTALHAIKYELAAVRFEVAVIRDALVCRKAGFRRDQPRWPQGTPGEPKPGGRWMPLGSAPAGAVIRTAGQSAAFCWNQMLIDNLLCDAVRVNWRRAACRAQANERYAACLVGRPLPPLSY